jgi:uncharacterized protein
MRQLHYLDTSEEMGRGLYANQDIKAGVVLFRAELLVLSPEDTIKVNETDLKWYTFKYNDNQDCLVLGDGEIFNHSDTANVGYTLTQYENRQVMVFVTIKDVKEGDQLFIDYSADVDVDPKSYTVNLFQSETP